MSGSPSPAPSPTPAGAGRRLRAPVGLGVDTAWRATAGAVVAYGGALLVAGLVGLLASDVSGQARSAGAERAQLAVQAVAFAGAALLLVELLRLARPPRGAEPLGAGAISRVAIPWPALLAAGAIAAIAATFVGPLVSALFPDLHDPARTVAGLGVGTGQGADLGTVLVIAGLVPLGEELLFRGVLAGAWLRARRPGAAIAVSTLLFSLAHVTVGGRAMVVTLLLGVLFAAAYVGSRSLGASVLAHGLVNAAALVDAGLRDPFAVTVLIATVGVATAAASRLSPLVCWLPPGGTLTR